MQTINKDMIIADILTVDADIAPILLKAGMHCLGCPSARGETLAQACGAHEADPDELVAEINAFLAAR